jgi:Spy/CpxP family protein refolding chaperone
MKRRIVFLAVLSVSLFLAVTALARGGEHGHGGKGRMGGPGCPMMALARCLHSPELQVTPDQTKKLEALHDELKAAMRETGPKLHEQREALLKAIADPKVPAEEVKAKARAVHEAMAAAMEKGLDTVLKIRGILTPEQLAKLPGLPGCKGPGPEGPETPDAR